MRTLRDALHERTADPARALVIDALEAALLAHLPSHVRDRALQSYARQRQSAAPSHGDTQKHRARCAAAITHTSNSMEWRLLPTDAKPPATVDRATMVAVSSGDAAEAALPSHLSVGSGAIIIVTSTTAPPLLRFHSAKLWRLTSCQWLVENACTCDDAQPHDHRHARRWCKHSLAAMLLCFCALSPSSSTPSAPAALATLRQVRAPGAALVPVRAPLSMSSSEQRAAAPTPPTPQPAPAPPARAAERQQRVQELLLQCSTTTPRALQQRQEAGELAALQLAAMAGGLPEQLAK
jgi:hypothetical protein